MKVVTDGWLSRHSAILSSVGSTFTFVVFEVAAFKYVVGTFAFRFFLKLLIVFSSRYESSFLRVYDFLFNYRACARIDMTSVVEGSSSLGSTAKLLKVLLL